MGFSLRAARWQRGKEKGDRSPFKVFLQQTQCHAGQLAAGSQDALIRLETSAERWGCWKRKDTQPTRRCLKTRSSEKERKKKKYHEQSEKYSVHRRVSSAEAAISTLCPRRTFRKFNCSLNLLWMPVDTEAAIRCVRCIYVAQWNTTHLKNCDVASGTMLTCIKTNIASDSWR